MKLVLSILCCFLLIASVAFAGPVQIDGDITVAGKNSGDVTSVGGAEASMFWDTVKARYGYVDDASTNVGGVNIHNRNVDHDEDITVINNNDLDVTNIGEKMNVGGVEIGKKYE